MMRIESVVIVKSLTDRLVVGEVPGPWPSEEAAVEEALHKGQLYQERHGVLYAQEMAACLYCSAQVADPSVVPGEADDAAWTALAAKHAAGCEWIETRAHRRE